jgi:hypothetical protein
MSKIKAKAGSLRSLTLTPRSTTRDHFFFFSFKAFSVSFLGIFFDDSTMNLKINQPSNHNQNTQVNHLRKGDAQTMILHLCGHATLAQN